MLLHKMLPHFASWMQRYITTEFDLGLPYFDIKSIASFTHWSYTRYSIAVPRGHGAWGISELQYRVSCLRTTCPFL